MRRTPTAILGKRTPIEKREPKDCDRVEIRIGASALNRAKYQYSEREATPLKSTYFEKQVLIEVGKSMWLPFVRETIARLVLYRRDFGSTELRYEGGNNRRGQGNERDESVSECVGQDGTRGICTLAGKARS
jgi:hypothetical protein